MNVTLTATEAAVFLLPCLPLCLWVMVTDLRDMRIPNIAVVALAGVFLCLGPFLLPPEAFTGRLLQAVAVLGLGFLITSLGLVGAGDSKWTAAMALYVAPGDLAAILFLFSGILVVSFLTHRLAGRVTSLRRAMPDWSSWEDKTLFPMGIALAPTLPAYLAAGL